MTKIKAISKLKPRPVLHVRTNTKMADLSLEEYLTTRELSGRIKYSEGTIRNLVWQKRLLENVHYVKPTPRKLLFLWSRVEQWLLGAAEPARTGSRAEAAEQSLINI
jgi:hypothetical protein